MVAGCLACLLPGLLPGLLAGVLAGLLAGWLACWLVKLFPPFPPCPKGLIPLILPALLVYSPPLASGFIPPVQTTNTCGEKD